MNTLYQVKKFYDIIRGYWQGNRDAWKGIEVDLKFAVILCVSLCLLNTLRGGGWDDWRMGVHRHCNFSSRPTVPGVHTVPTKPKRRNHSLSSPSNALLQRLKVTLHQRSVRLLYSILGLRLLPLQISAGSIAFHPPPSSQLVDYSTRRWPSTCAIFYIHSIIISWYLENHFDWG